MGLKYYSTNLKAPEVSFREALIGGLAPDGGLYMPRSIPKIGRDEIYKLKAKDYPEIAFHILKCLLTDDINNEILMDLCRDAYNFDVPVERVFDRTYILRLDRGPTLSFKDFAARMMARLMHFYTSRDSMNFTILTATSGDTGSAVAN
ncbi:MAG: threonine synthase, partial [Bacteroidales bacterium]|nr:threonine synthase [Bacteroidales bacterium]